jgi:ribosomal protein L6P/L9E
MALPKLNSAPTYEMEIPSTGQSVVYRPFLVKEQKNLLIAFEAQNRQDLVRAVIRTIEACVEETIDGSLTTFDVDYMFTKIRSKSVGETADILVPCTECETNNEVSIELDKVEVKGDVPEMTVSLTDDIIVKMKFPTYEEFLSNQNLLDSTTATEALLQLIVTCLDSVLTEEERFAIKDEPQEEIINFLESMTTEQFEKVSAFAAAIPSLSQDIEFACTSCGHNNKKTLKGLDDFF